MAKITTLPQMRTYIKRRLGAPVINIEVTDDQLDQIIEDSVQIMQKYNYGDGAYLDYVIFNVSAGQVYYDVMSNPATSAAFENVLQVVDLRLTLDSNGINTLFSPTHILLQENNNGQGMFGSRFLTGNFTPGLELTTYQVAMMYLTEIREKLGKMYTVNWIPGQQRLMITPAPAENSTGLLQLYKRDVAENLFNDNLVKDLCTARAKIQQGIHIRKYEMQMPGGGSAQGQIMINEGKEEEALVIEQIKGESEPIDFFFG